MSATPQSDFAAALLDSARPVPEGVTSHTSGHPARRFAVYRNNVVVSLVGALESRFPAVRSIVGDEFFRAMARVFVDERKPRSPVLMTYGDDFPDFIAAFPPAAELPYLADVARIEAARTRAYHATDASAADASLIARLDGDALAAARIVLHPSVEVVRSDHPVVTIWAMNAGEREPAPIESWTGEDALVARPDLTVTVTALPPGGAAFIEALAAGCALFDAAEAALAQAPGFDFALNLAALLGSGLAVGLAEDAKELVPWTA